MNVIETALPEVKIIEPTVFEDERGFFFESYNQQKFNDLVGVDVNFVQDNHSKSSKGVLRGLHYQLSPMTQGKLVRVVQGAVYDVAVDLRRSSPNFGKWIGVKLSCENKKQLWIPEGFGHGFITLSDTAEFLYKTTNYYSPEHERSIRWDDEEIGIRWPLEVAPVLSEKDSDCPVFNNAEVF